MNYIYLLVCFILLIIVKYLLDRERIKRKILT